MLVLALRRLFLLHLHSMQTGATGLVLLDASVNANSSLSAAFNSPTTAGSGAWTENDERAVGSAGALTTYHIAKIVVHCC